MKKFTLRIDALEVESFETMAGAGCRGTVAARGGEDAGVVVEPLATEAIGCKTPRLPCDSDLCNTTRQGEHTCAPIICVGFVQPEIYP